MRQDALDMATAVGAGHFFAIATRSFGD